MNGDWRAGSTPVNSSCGDAVQLQWEQSKSRDFEMRWNDNQIRLSASDLMRFTACPHATRLDLAYLQGEDLVPVDDSEDAILLQQHGDQHEIAHLQHLEAEGKNVVRIETEGVSFEESLKATRDALTAGADIVSQGALDGGMWGGYADFLERVPVPSELGAFSYEVTDTKLKRKPAILCHWTGGAK